MTNKNLKSEDFKTICKALRKHKSNKTVKAQPKNVRIVRIKRGDN